ncbi:BREX system serine/threonine kinase PglW [Natronosporangium hydrolyticum]|uniref:non-specific serine/threonine protein kinase n=2 Tax=Natronosporangium hydrolyticum TaxID=2811111 RepID=A0A895YMP0_9ACTN|nr:BREX system serine/threonine kinase PglW [Natronosporangium hydrolyticum]
MDESSPRWEQINPSDFEHERQGLRELASYLPDTDPFHVWANVEFVGTDGSINEVDALVLTPSGLYVLELKHWRGEIAGDGSHWVRRMQRGRLNPVDNPSILANRKAKRLAGLIRHYARQQGKDRQAPYVRAAIFLHAEDMRATQLDEIGRQHVYGLDGRESDSGLPSLKHFLLARPRNSDHLVDAALGRQIVELVRGAKIKPSVAERKVGQLILHPRPFAEGVGWQDFLAGHVMDTALVRRVRFYLTSRAPSEEVPVIRRAAEREFRLLQGIYHPGIARAGDLVDHPWGPAVVFDHKQEWVRFDQWLVQHDERLTMAQRLQLLQDLAEIVDYAHSRRLAHRALHPQAIYVKDPESSRPGLVVTDWLAGGRLAGATKVTRLSSSIDGAGLELFFDDEARRYQAPEAVHRSDAPGAQLDVFSLGTIAYRMFAGSAPTSTPEELTSAVRDSGLQLAAVADAIPVSLATLVYDATRGDPAQRQRTVAEFLAGLEAVWEELTAPDPEPVVDPLEARKGDVLDGGFTVVRRLGSGATATALLVTPPEAEAGVPAAERPASHRELVLKVARDEQHADRLAAEARALRTMRSHWQVAALVDGPLAIGGRTTLLLESAGTQTLAEDLAGGRRLALDLLERYGRDLMDIVTFLEGEGVWHRDIKPANLASRPRPKDRQPHLCIFDFSLAATPADQITAGTAHYLDPFLGPPRRLRYDAAAERFAAAVTLYEMATGTLPRWGDGANPAAISEEVSLDPASFDPAIADRLIGFFSRALAREVAARFDTAEEMADSWRMIFKDIPESPPEPQQEPAVTPESTLDDVGLTARARSALERLGLHTVGELLACSPSELTRAKGVPDATRKEILAQARGLRAQLPAEPPPPAEPTTAAYGVEALCATLLPGERAKHRANVEVLLGQAPASDGSFLGWLSQSDAAKFVDLKQPQISTLLRQQAKSWLANPDLTQVRDEIVALLDARGAVMSAGELAEALKAARGSFTVEPKGTSQTLGLVRAAVEAELTRGGDARLATHRIRGGDRAATTVLVGREPDDPDAETTAADLLAYAVRLGRRAEELAQQDPLPTRARAVESLRAIAAPETMPALGDARLLQLAAAASNDAADVNAQGQLYPVGMAVARTLRLAAGSLVGQRLPADEVRARVRARFPRAEELPTSRLDLDGLLAACDVPLAWDSTKQEYAPPTVGVGNTSTRLTSTVTPVLRLGDAEEADAKLAAAVDRPGFLAVLTPLRQLAVARRALLGRFPLTEVNVTAIMLERLRALDYPWEAVVAADSGPPTDPDFRSLADLVQHEVVPAVEEALATPAPVLLTDAAPLARYDALGVVQQLADPTRPRPAARLLLAPARRPVPAMLDDVQLPLTSPTNQSIWLPDTWVSLVEVVGRS